MKNRWKKLRTSLPKSCTAWDWSSSCGPTSCQAVVLRTSRVVATNGGLLWRSEQDFYGDFHSFSKHFQWFFNVFSMFGRCLSLLGGIRVRPLLSWKAGGPCEAVPTQAPWASASRSSPAATIAVVWRTTAALEWSSKELFKSFQGFWACFQAVVVRS